MTNTGTTDQAIREFATTDAVRIMYRRLGTGDPVIVCHGGPSTTYAYLFDDLAPVAERFALIFHDYRGSGQSELAPADTYTFERLADDVDELRRHVGAERVRILAHSMGGFVALEYAIRYPEHCRSLGLISCSPAGTVARTAVPTLKALGAVRTARVLGRASWYIAARSWRRESEMKTASRYSMMHIMQEGDQRFRDAVATREKLANNDNASALERLAFQTDMWDRLGQIGCPVLVIHGSKDAPFVAGGRLLERAIPNVRRIELKGAGHHPLVERHELTSREIIEFLAASA